MPTCDVQKIIASYPDAFPGSPAAPGLETVLNFINTDSELTGPFALQKAAYMLATFKWETAHTLKPVEEIGKGRDRSYGKPDENGKTYYGRGYVQLTWKKNYQAASLALGIDLVNDPSLACEPDIAYQIASWGMRLGKFTGVGLDRYLNANMTSTESAYVNARRIINGTDHAGAIADTAVRFEKLLTDALIT